MYTSTCQIYSKNPGTAYKIPWTSGQLSWATGDYIAFVPNVVNGVQNSTNPWKAIQYNTNGTQKAIMGLGHIINMGTGYFFFVGSDNNTGQLFSTTTGMSNTAGVSWTGTLNPTVAQVDAAATTWSTAPLAAGETYTSAPSLCCGGSSTSFNMSAANVTQIQTFINRASTDAQVYINQIGNANTITVNQTGSKNNYVNYTGNGSNNTVNINETATGNNMANFTVLTILGNNNTANLSQQSTGGTKQIFGVINGDNNLLSANQSGSGNQSIEATLLDGNKKVDITQQGSGNHMAKVELSGQPTDLSLSQTGSTNQSYSIQFNCATLGGCPAISVQQQ